MRCLNPFVSGRAAFGCGQCMPCRFNRRRMWTHRVLLEGLCHADKCFVTLTYSDENNGGELVPRHLQDWLKRLRRRFEPKKLRFYAVGEYGDTTVRPHYHAALFGFPSCFGGPIGNGVCNCYSCRTIRETWGLGHVMVGNLEEASAQYLCGYITKKMTSKSDHRLDGKHPEFCRMSLRPGIGAGALWEVASAMMAANISNTLPSQLRHGPRLLPLGRYLRKKLSERLGQSDVERESISDQALSRLYEELSLVRSVAWATEKSVREVFREVNTPYSEALEGRSKLKIRRL